MTNSGQNATPNCNICNGRCLHVYSPIGSMVGLELYICSSCGFLQTTKSLESIREDNETFRGLSCDADYSSVRVGKRQMLDNSRPLLDQALKLLDSKPRILDMAAGRGDFLIYAKSWQPSRLVGFEPDEYMVRDSKVHDFAELTFGDYRTMSREDQFDLIYSCHSLEHFSNPAGYFDFVTATLSPNGLFFVDVPNVREAHKGLVLDEYFYDKHRVYFDSGSLDQLAAKYGLKAIFGQDEGASLVRAYKFDQPVVGGAESGFDTNLALIEQYREKMAQSRSRIPNVVQQVTEVSKAHKGQVILFGAGRATDALVKYGGLDLTIFYKVVDNYLGQASSTVLGREIITFDELEILDNPLFVVATKSSTSTITKLIRSKFPAAQLMSLGDIFGSNDLAHLP